METITQPKTFNPLLTTEVEPKSIQGTFKGESVTKPKHVLAGTEIPAFLFTPALQVKFSTLGDNGDKLGTTARFGPTGAKYELTLVCGVPDKVKRVMPTLEADQAKTFELFKVQHEQLVTLAFDNDDVKCTHKKQAFKKAKKELKGSSDEDIRNRALEIYIENAKNSGFKLLNEDTDDEVETLRATRNVTGWRNGEETTLFPKFHKIDHEGEYHAVEFGDFIPSGTLVKLRARVEWYSMPLQYGTSIKFDEDVVVLWKPKKRVRERVTNPVPVFSDGEDDEHDNKKARN